MNKYLTKIAGPVWESVKPTLVADSTAVGIAAGGTTGMVVGTEAYKRYHEKFIAPKYTGINSFVNTRRMGAAGAVVGLTGAIAGGLGAGTLAYKALYGKKKKKD